MEKFLESSEINNQTVIMVILEGHTSEPFYVVEKKAGLRIIGTVIYWGERLKTLIHSPYIFCKVQHRGMNRLFALGEPNRKNVDVIGYRRMTQEEKDEWIEKISLIPELNELVDVIKNS